VTEGRVECRLTHLGDVDIDKAQGEKEEEGGEKEIEDEVVHPVGSFACGRVVEARADETCPCV
jgi:hypothetical protein